MIDLFFRGRRLLLESPLTPEEATRRLQSEVAAPVWPARREGSLFVGSFTGGRFHMARRVSGRNSFRMWMEGTLIAHGPGTRIDARMKVHPLVVLFLLGMAAFIAPFLALAAAEALRTGPEAPHLVVLAFPLLGAVFLCVTLLEARKASRLLQSVFDARPVRP